MSFAPPVKNYADVPPSLRSGGIAVISINRVVAQAQFRIAAKRGKTMSRRDRVSDPAARVQSARL